MSRLGGGENGRSGRYHGLSGTDEPLHTTTGKNGTGTGSAGGNSTSSSTAAHALDGEERPEESLQESLLTRSPSNDEGDDDVHLDPVNNNSTNPPHRVHSWVMESPPQLHCVLKSLVDSWKLIFPHVRRLGPYLYCLTILTMLVVIPMVTYKAVEEGRFDYAAFDSAGVMVLGTLVLSFRLIYLHLTHWYMPQVQKYVVRIVWMVPLYAVQSWLSLKYRDARIYINAIRDLYEAFVIASFLYLIIELLGGQDALVSILESKREAQSHLGKHAWPLNQLLHNWELGTEFMMQCKHGVLQYVVVKTVATVLTYLFETTNCYGEGNFKWNSAYPYLAFLLNCSVMYALYVLVMLFHAVREELKHPVNWHPLGKFLCVKGVVFFTWWQGVIIFYAQNKGFIKPAGNWTGSEISNGLIDYCVCTEMVFFAIAHSYTFSYKEYLPSSIPPDLRNLTLNANVNANANVHAATPTNNSSVSGAVPLPLRLEPSQSTMSSHSATANSNTAVRPTYRPPAVLDQPLNFREAFWSSSIPKETVEDIRRLRVNADAISRGRTNGGTISLQDFQSETLEANTSIESVRALGAAAAAEAMNEAETDADIILTVSNDEERSSNNDVEHGETSIGNNAASR